MPAAQNVTLRNAVERSLFRISASQPSVHASATTNAIHENCPTNPGSSRVKWRATEGGNPVVIANQPNHTVAPRIPMLMTPNQVRALAAPRRRRGPAEPAPRRGQRPDLVRRHEHRNPRRDRVVRLVRDDDRVPAFGGAPLHPARARVRGAVLVDRIRRRAGVHAGLAGADPEKRALHGVPQRDVLGRGHHPPVGSCNDAAARLDRLRQKLPPGCAGAEEEHPRGDALRREPRARRGAARHLRLPDRSAHATRRAPRRHRLPGVAGAGAAGRLRQPGPGVEIPLGRAAAARPRALPALPEGGDAVVSALVRSSAWQALAAHQKTIAATTLAGLFAADPARAQRFSLEGGGVFLDYSKHCVDAQALRLLADLAAQAQVPRWIDRMFAGEPINNTEQRAVLHVALRARDAGVEVRETRERMRRFVAEVRDRGRITDVVNIGIGGSDLGPRMLTRALRAFHRAGPRVHFVSNIDPADLDATLAGLTPQTTLFIVASKTFTTAETLANAGRARAWLESGLGK